MKPVVDSRRFYEHDVIEMPEGVVRIIKNNFWWCVGGDCHRAVFNRYELPMCNENHTIASQFNFSDKVPVKVNLVKIPVAFAPYEHCTRY